MDTPSAHGDLASSTIDDTERHDVELGSLTEHSDQTPSTYDILGVAVIDDTAVSHTEYSLATLWDAIESHSTMPGAHGGLKPWPNIRSPTPDDHSHNATTQLSKEQASAMASRAHYEPTYQPLSVSQQTSASSVRDMALRKGTSAVLRKEEKTGARPLKSALKRYPSAQREQVAHPQFLYPPEYEPPIPIKQQSRLSRFGTFFSRRSSSNKSIASPQVSRTPSAASNYTPPTGPRRKRSIGWDQPLQQYDIARTASTQSDHSDVVRQAKLAQDDVYEKAKINIRRPPKGITNWFDGVDISSDEDDLTPVELPASEALPSIFSTFSPDRKSGHERRRSQQKELVQGRQLTKAERVLGQSAGLARHEADTIDEQLLPRDFDARDDYLDHRATTPKASAQMRNSRAAPPVDVSVMSTTSILDDDDADTDFTGRPSTAEQYSSQSERMYNHDMSSQRPPITPRRLQNAQIASHNAFLNQRPQLPPHNSSSKFSKRSNITDDSYDDRPTTASRRSSHRTNPDTTKSRGRHTAQLSSPNGYSEGSGGVPVDALSSEISHMMNVTEEEMALLEMMRNKRAAMQKSSYSEGYRQALKREHEHLMQRRKLAQQTALRILRTQQEQEMVRERQAVDYHDLDDKEIRRLNKLRQQEMDRTKRLEKFLAMDTSLAAALDDAGVPQDDLIQDWPLPKHGSSRLPTEDTRPSRKSAAIASFSRRDVYDESTTQNHRRSRAGLNDFALKLPEPLDLHTSSHHKKTHSREATPNLVRQESGSNEMTKAHRKSQALYSRQTTADAAYRQELYLLQSQSTVRATKGSQPSRQQIQSTTFLRSNSDYHPMEANSVTSQGSASVSASIVSPMTPSSTGAGPVGKLLTYGAMESEDGDYLDRSSPEMTFAKPPKKRQLPSALAILAESDRSSYRNSMASNNSAGEDVLAAWAELGGNEGMLPSRSSRTTRAV